VTLAPTAQVRGVEGKRPARNSRCSVPGCISLSQHGHHIWSRSYLRGQPYEWVRLQDDGSVVCNTTGLCAHHHDWVTGMIGGHKARVEYVEGVFVWQDFDAPELSGPLFPQPVRQGSQPKPHLKKEVAHTHLAPGETCESCGYTKPIPGEPGPKRRAKTWAMTVPDDAEDGAEVLDGWVADFAAVLGLDPASPRLLRYHAVVTVLAWAHINMPLLIKDWQESA
jgi:hypothetical protein